jgi:hypothetical protein
MEQYVFYRPVNKKRFKGSALSRRLVSSNENLLASYLENIPDRGVKVKLFGNQFTRVSILKGKKD